MRRLSAVLAVFLLVIAAGRVCGQTPLVERLQDLDLSDQQEAKIAEIQKTNRPKVEEAARALSANVKKEVDQIREVLTPEQRQKAESLKDERQERREECLSHSLANLKELDLTDAETTKIGEIRAEFRPAMAKALKELEGLLTDGQRKAREEGLASGKSRKEILQSLKLTEAQREKVTSVGKDMRSVARDELQQVRNVFTAEQAEKAQAAREERKEQVRDRMAHRIANYQDLNLTDEQKAKIAAIRQEYRPKIQETGNKLRAAVRDEMDQVLAVLKG